MYIVISWTTINLIGTKIIDIRILRISTYLNDVITSKKFNDLKVFVNRLRISCARAQGINNSFRFNFYWAIWVIRIKHKLVVTRSTVKDSVEISIPSNSGCIISSFEINILNAGKNSSINDSRIRPSNVQFVYIWIPEIDIRGIRSWPYLQGIRSSTSIKETG